MCSARGSAICRSIVSTALSALLEDEFPAKDEVLPIGGRALREMTRLGASPFSMWRDVAHTNTEAVAARCWRSNSASHTCAKISKLLNCATNSSAPIASARRCTAEKVAGPKTRVSMVDMRRRMPFSSALFFCAPACHSTTRPPLLVDVDHRPSTSLNGPGTTSSIPITPAGDRIPPTVTCPARAAMRRTCTTSPAARCGVRLRKVPDNQGSRRLELAEARAALLRRTALVQREFDYHPKAHTQVFLHIGAANYAAHVFVNDVHVCDHEGGFTPFDCEITSAVKDGRNFVVIAVENTRALDRVPTIKSDWWNYGGLTREVRWSRCPRRSSTTNSFT